jgi:predicted RNase H-like nuclease (RuvC/YqgF family)
VEPTFKFSSERKNSNETKSNDSEANEDSECEEVEEIAEETVTEKSNLKAKVVETSKICNLLIEKVSNLEEGYSNFIFNF